jgi:hypothetical protein
MTDSPRKPFWKRKRWIAAAVAWLVVMYPLSLWPVAYLDGRDVIKFRSPTDNAIATIHRPLTWLSIGALSPAFRWLEDTSDFFFRLGKSHKGER